MPVSINEDIGAKSKKCPLPLPLLPLFLVKNVSNAFPALQQHAFSFFPERGSLPPSSPV